MSVTVKHMEKIVLTPDPENPATPIAVVLHSIDGVTWGTDIAALKRRIQSAILPEVHSPILGKEKGKKHALRRNLRTKKEPEVRFVKAVHFHRCHGRKYSCSCDTPWFRRPCGGSQCVFNLLKERITK